MSAIGFPDFRRQVDYDSTAPVMEINKLVTGTETTAIFYVGQFANLAGLINCNGGVFVRVVVWWYNDAAGAVPMGTRQFCVDAAAASNYQVNLPNLGRYAQVTLQRSAALNYVCLFRLWGSNRITARAFQPVQPILVQLAGGAFPVGVTTVLLTDMYTGEMTIKFSTGAQPGHVLLQFLSPASFSYVDFYQIANLAAGLVFTGVTFVPPGGLAVLLSNNGAAPGAFELIGTPDLSNT